METAVEQCEIYANSYPTALPHHKIFASIVAGMSLSQ